MTVDCVANFIYSDHIRKIAIVVFLSETVEKGRDLERFLHSDFVFSFLSISVFDVVKLFFIFQIISFKNKKLCVI